jgi:two-component system sensor histidine kinase AtoS
VDDRLSTTTGVGRGVFQSTRLAAENRYQQASRALNLVRDSVVVLDRNGRVTYVNHAAEELYSLTALEMIGRAARTTLFADSKIAFDAAWREVLANGEWHGAIAQRTERLMESRWSALRDNHSSRVTFVLIVSKEISNTAASIAHEIKNQLAGIKGVADAFLQRRRLTRKEREWMEAVRQEAMKIDGRLRELLDLAPGRVSKTSLCSLNSVVSRMVLLATKSIVDRQISIEFTDDTAEPIVMPLDSARIEDAVLNLLLNAIESIDGDGRVTVRLRRSLPNDAVIEVTDSGCGIPLEIRKRIFEPLFTTKQGGTGLGLVAVRRTAAAYHGRITFKTRIGRGSTFVFTLPIRSQPSLAETQE